jgi:hypothetical protein
MIPRNGMREQYTRRGLAAKMKWSGGRRSATPGFRRPNTAAETAALHLAHMRCTRCRTGGRRSATPGFRRSNPAAETAALHLAYARCTRCRTGGRRSATPGFLATIGGGDRRPPFGLRAMYTLQNWRASLRDAGVSGHNRRRRPPPSMGFCAASERRGGPKAHPTCLVSQIRDNALSSMNTLARGGEAFAL